MMRKQLEIGPEKFRPQYKVRKTFVGRGVKSGVGRVSGNNNFLCLITRRRNGETRGDVLVLQYHARPLTDRRRLQHNRCLRSSNAVTVL